MRYGNKRNFRKYKKSYRKYNKVSRGVKRYVKKAIDKNIEDKVNILQPITGTYGSISTNWSEYSFFQPTQGVGQSQRVGNSIRMKSIKIYGVIATGASEVALDDPYNVIRIVIGIYKGSSGVTPMQTAGVTINQPLDKVTLTTASVSLERLMLDKYIPLVITSTEKGAGDGYTPGLRIFRYYKRISRRYSKIFFGDNSVTYPDRRLIVSMLSDSTGVPNPGFVTGYVKVTYEDA